MHFLAGHLVLTVLDLYIPLLCDKNHCVHIFINIGKIGHGSHIHVASFNRTVPHHRFINIGKIGHGSHIHVASSDRTVP